MGHTDHIVDLDFAARTDAQIAVDASIEVDGHCRVAEIGGDLLVTWESAFGDFDPIGPLPQPRSWIVRGFALGLVGEQQLKYQLAGFLRACRCGLDFHTLGRFANARSCENAFALYFHHAGATISVGAIVACGRPAKMRDLDALAVGDLPYGLVGRGADFCAIERKLDCLAHFTSSAKCSTVMRIGLTAA